MCISAKELCIFAKDLLCELQNIPKTEDFLYVLQTISYIYYKIHKRSKDPLHLLQTRGGKPVNRSVITGSRTGERVPVFASSYSCVTWLVRVCVWHDSFMCVFAVCWLSLVAAREKLFWYSLPPIRVWHDSFISDVWHDSILWVPWLIHMCNVFLLSLAAARERVFWYLVSSYPCVTWLVHMCGMTHS